MPSRDVPVLRGSFPRPEGALKGVLLVIFGLWVVFAVLINWFGVAEQAYGMLVLDIERLLRGEVWRLFTAPLVHLVSGHGGVSHVTSTLLLLYFFGVPLQRAWGPRRFLTLLAVAAVVGELVQIGATLAAPAALAHVIAQPILLGGHAMALACIIAWGFSHRDETVQLFFVLPMRGITVVWITIGFEVLSLIGAGGAPEGLLAPFGGMLVGYALGGSTPSPLQKLLRRRGVANAMLRGEPKLRVVRTEKGRDGSKDEKRWLN